MFIIVDCEKFSPLQMISTLSSIKHTRLNIVVRIVLKENVQFKQRFERREGFSQSDSFFFFLKPPGRQKRITEVGYVEGIVRKAGIEEECCDQTCVSKI